MQKIKYLFIFILQKCHYKGNTWEYMQVNSIGEWWRCKPRSFTNARIKEMQEGAGYDST